MEALVMGMMKIEINFLLKELNGLTLVDEEIHFNSLLPVKWQMKTIFKKQYNLFF